MAEARDAAFIDSSSQVTTQRGVRTNVIKRLSGLEWTAATPDTVRLLDHVFADGG
jgi:hypothetical protein